jgi:hypothetical protein
MTPTIRFVVGFGEVRLGFCQLRLRIQYRDVIRRFVNEGVPL